MAMPIVCPPLYPNAKAQSRTGYLDQTKERRILVLNELTLTDEQLRMLYKKR
jgi:hypothetical protein